jgi:hypothetical protein
VLSQTAECCHTTEEKNWNKQKRLPKSLEPGRIVAGRAGHSPTIGTAKYGLKPQLSKKRKKEIDTVRGHRFREAYLSTNSRGTTIGR